MKQRVWQILLLLLTTSPTFGQITNASDVERVLAQALTRANDLMSHGTISNANPVVAVVDREGFVLGVRSLLPDPAELDIVDAITKAGTAAFLSSDQNAFSSRTAGFIVGQHFPPGIRNRPPGPLVGVNFSNMSFSDVNRFKNPHTYDPLSFGGGGTNGAAITDTNLAALSGLAGSPGGVPLYQHGKLIGGVGAAATGHMPIPALYDIQQTSQQQPDFDEDIALAGQTGFEPAKAIFGSSVFIDGIRVPYVNTTTKLNTNGVIIPFGSVFGPYEPTNSPPVSYPATNLSGIIGEMRAPIIDDPVPGLIEGEARLSASDVTNILTLAAKRAAITRAGIRLPAGQPAEVFISVVNNPNQAGQAPVVLGTFRTPGATIFSWDVSVQKARTALYFSTTNFFMLTNPAFSTRTVGFLAQSLYPPGIVGTAPGPFLSLQEQFSLLPANVTNVLNGVHFTVSNAPPPIPDASLPNGITIFPGGFPLYRNGKIIGAVGVSGDGVDQDDIIAASGTVNFLPPTAIRGDQFKFKGARLPYAKFPRNPSL
jgi:uncharacterized protein GlcG (DUF336 family)